MSEDLAAAFFKALIRKKPSSQAFKKPALPSVSEPLVAEPEKASSSEGKTE